MVMKARANMWVGAALAAPLLAVSGAHAQEAVARAEVVVTATPFRDERDDIVQGAVAIQREDLIATLGNGLGETLEREAGVSSTFFGAGASRPIIRGLGEDRIRILTNGLGQIDASSVSPDHAVAAEGIEAETVEILRGPSALAFGGNAVGGVVNVLDGRILEAAPEDALSGAFFGSVATGTDAVEGAANATLASDRFALRIDGFSRSSGDYEIPDFAFSESLRDELIADGEDPSEFARDTAPNTFAESDGYGVGLSTFGEWGYAGVSVRRLESLYGIPKAPGLEEEEEEEEIFAGPRIDLEQDRYEARLGLSRGFGPFTGFNASAAFVDYTHTEIEPTGEAGTVFANEGYEARFEAPHEVGPFVGVIGLTRADTDFSAEGEEAFVTPTTITDTGVYLVERVALSPQLILDAGVRYEQRGYDNEDFGERDFDLWSGSASAAWRPTPAWLFGVTLARTERAPTEIELFADGGHLATATFELGDPTLDKETATSIEGVVRWSQPRWSVDVNVFHIDFQDFTSFFDTGLEDLESGLPIFAAAQEDASFTGGEISGWLSLFDRDGLSLTADVSYEIVDAELDSGGNVPRIPPNALTLGLEGEAGHFGGRLEWVSASEQDDVAAFETPTEGYDVVNARLNFRPVANSDRLVFSLDGRNLTDEEVRVHSSFVKDLLPRPGRSLRFVISGRF
jgi:iron complex outermembrane receptor protein